MGTASISSLDCLFAVSLSLAPQLGLGKIVPEKEEIRTTVPAARRGGPAPKKMAVAVLDDATAQVWEEARNRGPWNRNAGSGPASGPWDLFSTASGERPKDGGGGLTARTPPAGDRAHG
jgi:hypothetical protein